jgi:hypothetical protein
MYNKLNINDMSGYLKTTLFGVLCAMLTYSTDAFAQKEALDFSARNSLYLELGGSSGRYAVNYSRIIHQKEKLKLNVSAGFTLWHHHRYDMSLSNRRTTWLPGIPIEFSAFWGRSNHHLEFGVGLIPYLAPRIQIDADTFEASDKIVFGAIVPLRIGYRYQKPGGGFFYRVGYTPLFIVPVGGRENWSFEPRFAGVSIGKSF